MKSALYVGSVAHRRSIPKTHRFQYHFFMWFLNLDTLESLPPLRPYFALNTWAFSRFCRSDYLGDPTMPLADAVRARMAELTGRPVTGEVCGLMNMRTFGLYFSPVNFYYGYDEDGNFSHFLAEVSNIPWNERHQYGHYVGDGQFCPAHPKMFRVSPFNPLDQGYRWTIEAPGETLGVKLDVDDRRGHIFAARLRLRRHPLTLSSVRFQLLKRPVMTAFIVAGIYWQALRLYLKGVPYIPYRKEVT